MSGWEKREALGAAMARALGIPLAPKRAPRRWGGFVHLLARRFQNYPAAVRKAAKRKRKRRVDVDVQESVQGTLWALHWATVGRNKLHDPQGHIGRGVRIDRLTDEQIARLRGPQGQRTHELGEVLALASDLLVEVEAEVKVAPRQDVVARLLHRRKIAAMHARGDLVWKTLAWLGGRGAAVKRLRPIHKAGGVTLLSFTGFGRRRGISKRAAWPVTDYVRGRARWTA